LTAKGHYEIEDFVGYDSCLKAEKYGQIDNVNTNPNNPNKVRWITHGLTYRFGQTFLILLTHV